MSRNHLLWIHRPNFCSKKTYNSTIKVLRRKCQSISFIFTSSKQRTATSNNTNRKQFAQLKGETGTDEIGAFFSYCVQNYEHNHHRQLKLVDKIILLFLNIIKEKSERVVSLLRMII